MNNPTPIRCNYCEAVSEWSAEPADSQELGSAHECHGCDEATTVWADSVSHQLGHGGAMPWAAPDPFP